MEEALEESLNPPGQQPSRRSRRPKFKVWRLVVMLLAGVYFLLPLYAGLKFSLQNDAGHFSFTSVKVIPSAQGFSAAFFLSMKLALVTVVLAMVLMVPTSIYVHLRLPRVRRIVEFITILPIVIPPIILIQGVLGAFPGWAKASPYLLSFVYVILAMPFVYRSLDAGLSAIDLKTLVEASRSLGGSWVQTLRRVVMPNLRPSLLSAMVLTLALVLGEYTMASLDLWETIPVWIVNFQQTDGHVTVAASMAGLIGTWLLLTVIVSLDRSQSRRSRRKAGTS
jgi:putative spermidine/putrescine transport system permease protein